jgi:outer membrane protein assembly factor BamA
LELEIRPEDSWETTLGYYGLGDASSAAIPAGDTDKFFEYGRLHPELYIQLRWRLLDHVIGRTGIRYVQNWIQVASNSKLEQDLLMGSPEVKELLGSTSPSGVALLDYGIQFDNRDNNVSAHRGTFDSFDVQVSPGGTPWLPYRYAQATADLRFYIPISMPHVTLAGRVAGDILYGNPPFYELARFEDTYAIGGLNGVRGVPAQRYYGKVKALGNVELRTELASFHALGKPLVFGVVAFLDGGRVWADTTAQPQLDGRTAGLKYGVGGGLRLQSGSAFVLRADVAWSPDATPIGGYVAAGQMF